MAPRVTESELLDALAKAAGGSAPEDARTMQELADAAGCSRRKVQDTLRMFQTQGRLRVHRVRRTRLDGVVQPVPAYTILPAKRAQR